MVSPAMNSILHHLRGSSSSLGDHNHRELHGEHSIFDNPGSSHSQIDNSVINQYAQQLQQQQQQTQLQPHPASWGTLASFFLLTQGIVIFFTIIILILCVRKHRHQRIRQRIASIAQMQAWSTRMGTSTPSEAAASIDIESGGQSAGRSSGNAEADAARGSGVSAANDSASLNNTGDRTCPRPSNVFLSMSRTFGNAILHPFRALRTAINDWATGDYDEVFLRQLMERMEAEREAAKENPSERARRLKEAFVKAGTVWELADEHFIPPTRLGGGFSSSVPLSMGFTTDGVKEESGEQYGISPTILHGKTSATNTNVDWLESFIDQSGINDSALCQVDDNSNHPGPTVSALVVETQPASVDAQQDALLGSNSRADSLEPNQMYIYLKRSAHDTLPSVDAESVNCIPNTVHLITNQCAICLCDYEKGDTIVTSCNDKCPHAFHQECIVEWLVKMQENTTCPCCRRSFIDLNTLNPWYNNNNNLTSTTRNNAINTTQNPNNAMNLHSDRRRWRISFWGQSTNTHSRDSVEEITEAERLRQEWVRHIIDQELRRRRAFNASVISLR